MRDIGHNLASGALCLANLGIAGLGALSTLTLKDKASIFAALATGAWFTLQIVLALIDRRKKARRAQFRDRTLD